MKEPAPDPQLLHDVLEEVLRKTKRPAHWLSVNMLDLAYSPDRIDAAIRILVERGLLNASPMSLHSVSITAEGRKQISRP